jgi:hypothetical protein
MRYDKISLKQENWKIPQKQRFTGAFLAVQVHYSRTANAPTGQVQLWVSTDGVAPMIQARKPEDNSAIVYDINQTIDNLGEGGFVFENPGYEWFELRYVRNEAVVQNPTDLSTNANWFQVFHSQTSYR